MERLIVCDVLHRCFKERTECDQLMHFEHSNDTWAGLLFVAQVDFEYFAECDDEFVDQIFIELQRLVRFRIAHNE